MLVASSKTDRGDEWVTNGDSVEGRCYAFPRFDLIFFYLIESIRENRKSEMQSASTEGKKTYTF